MLTYDQITAQIDLFQDSERVLQVASINQLIMTEVHQIFDKNPDLEALYSILVAVDDSSLSRPVFISMNTITNRFKNIPSVKTSRYI